MEPSTNLEYAAVRHVLTSPQIEPRTAEYVTADGFDFTGLAAESEAMSGGEKLLVAIAHELWHAEKKAGLWELVRRLDAANFRRSILAEDGWVIPTGRRARPGSTGGKPAELYRAGRMWKHGGPIRYPQPPGKGNQ